MNDCKYEKEVVFVRETNEKERRKGETRLIQLELDFVMTTLKMLTHPHAAAMHWCEHSQLQIRSVFFAAYY